MVRVSRIAIASSGGLDLITDASGQNRGCFAAAIWNYDDLLPWWIYFHCPEFMSGLFRERCCRNEMG